MNQLFKLSMALLAAGAVGAYAGDAYPNRPITVVAPYSAGGDSDLAARNFAAAAEKALGTPVIVVNKPGASGLIGSEFVKNAAPDGYTLLLARPGSQAILPAILPSKTRYKWDDFTFVGLLELNAYGCFVKGSSPYHDFKEFAQALKTNGAQMNYGTAGVLTTNDMGPRQLFKELNLGATVPTQLPYKGTGEATVSLMGGQSQFACGSVGSFIPMLKSGQLRALMVTTPQRLAWLPDVPTAREVGVPSMEGITGWSGIYAPRGTPPEIVKKLADAMATFAKDERWLKGTENTGSVPFLKGPEETRKFAHDQYALYRSLGESLAIIDKQQ